MEGHIVEGFSADIRQAILYYINKYIIVLKQSGHPECSIPFTEYQFLLKSLYLYPLYTV